MPLFHGQESKIIYFCFFFCGRLAIFFVVGMLVLWGLFYFSGVVAYGIYSDCDPLISGRIEKADQILPYLVMDKLAYIKGLPGLFVAAVYGGMLR